MLNFNLPQKDQIKNLLLWITTIGQASIALYLPSLPIIAKDLAASETEVLQTITVFIIGFGISPILYGPMSDRYGRKPILISSLTIALLGYLININANSLLIFNIARTLQGLGCGGILVSGRSIIRDVFSGRELASASSYLSMGYAVGFGLSPSLGGIITHYLGWKFNFVFLLVITLIIISFVIFLLPETIKKKHHHPQLILFIQQSIDDYCGISCNLIFLRYLIGGLFAYSVVMAYNVMTPFLMQQIFLLSPTEYGYLAICIGVPYYLAASINRTLVLKFGLAPMLRLGFIIIICSGVLILFLNIFFIPKIIFCIIPMMLATFGQALIFSNTISGALQEFPSALGGKASAIFSSLQMLSVSIISGLMTLLPNHSPISLGLVIMALGFLTLIILLKPIRVSNR